jgi:hypothetical protein
LESFMQGLVTGGIQNVIVSDDGSAVRLILTQDGNPFYVELPLDNLAGSLAILVKAIEMAKRPSEVVAVTVSEAAVDLDQAGDVLLTLENIAGAQMTYLLSIGQVTQLSALFDTALQRRSGSTGRH